MQETKRRIIWHGIFLFFLGLITGFVETQFSNPRMGLAAHLEGLMNGTFLIALGAIWTEIRLSLAPEAAAFWTALIGAYGNWATTTMAATFGTAALSPIKSCGQRIRANKEGMWRLQKKPYNRHFPVY